MAEKITTSFIPGGGIFAIGYPGVWVCPQHGELLQVSTLKSTGVERFQWHLPEVGILVPFSEDVSGESSIQLTRLAEMISLLVDSGEEDGWLRAPIVQSALRSRVSERGWVQVVLLEALQVLDLLGRGRPDFQVPKRRSATEFR